MTLYVQLADEFRRAITHGVFETGDRLPSVREVSEDKLLSMNTVLKAYRVLEEEGWIRARERSGYFVNQQQLDESAPIEPWSGEFEDLMPKLLANAQNRDVLNLGLAQPEAELIPHAEIAKSMRRVVRESGPEVLGYCDPAGLWELRRQIAKSLRKNRLTTDIDNIIVTNGCQEALNVAFQILTTPGEIVAVQSPTYCGALQALSNLGLRILEIPASADNGIDQVALRAANQRLNGRIACCYVMTGVSNPQGATMSREDKESLCELAEEQGFSIVEDFTNGELTDSEEDRRPIKSYDPYDNVVLCSSFSKTLSPGLRTGWIVAGRHQAEALKIRYGSSLSASTLNQMIIAQMLSNGEYRRHLARVRPVHAQTLRLLRSSIEDQFPRRTVVSPPGGGYCLWVRLPRGYDTEKISVAAKDRSVMFAPGRIFSVNRDYSNYLRVGWGGRWSSRIAQGVGTLADVIRRSN